MKIIPQNNIPNFSLPLPIFHSIHIADAIARDGEEFSVFVGLEKKYVEQLKQLSLDKNDIDLQNNTGDRERFGEGSYEDWYKKPRTPFTLIHKKTDALAALVWLGPSPLLPNQENWHTVGWRSYKPFRGKGIMKVFAQFVIDFYRGKVSNTKLWIEIRNENTGSIKLATGLDFQILEEESDDVSLVMVLY